MTPSHDITTTIQGGINAAGYHSYIVASRTESGNSDYIQVGLTEDFNSCTTGESVKVRISDHSVENMYRMGQEIHVSNDTEITPAVIDHILIQIGLRLGKYDLLDIVDNVEVHSVGVVNDLLEKALKPTDTVISQRAGKGGKVIYSVKRPHLKIIQQRRSKLTGRNYDRDIKIVY